jgi:hypothetical protein
MTMTANEEAPFLNMVVECDQNGSMHDSFSTLGIQSIFADEEITVAMRYKEQQRTRRATAALDKFLEEDSHAEDAATTSKNPADLKNVMDLQTLLHHGAQLQTSTAFEAKWNGNRVSYCDKGIAQQRNLLNGDRWQEAGGMSVSCRNLGLDYTSESIMVDPSQRWESVPKNWRDIVTEAIELTVKERRLVDVSAVSGDSQATEDDDIDSLPKVPSQSSSRDRRAGGRMELRSQSCRNFTYTGRGADSKFKALLSPGGATSKVMNGLQKKKAVKTLLQSQTNSRKTMLTMGKSLSARNLTDSTPNSPDRRGMATSVSYRNTRRKDTEDHDLRLSTSMRFVQVPDACASFNGRKFVSYSRSLSCKDFTMAKEEEPKSTTVASANSRWAEASSKAPVSQQTGMPKAKREVTKYRASLSFDSSVGLARPNVFPAPTVEKAKPSTPTSLKKRSTLSAFLDKTQKDAELYESQKLRLRVDATPCSKRSTLALAGKSKSLWCVVREGRRTLLQAGKAPSALPLAADYEDSLPTLSPMSTITSAPSTPADMTDAQSVATGHMDESLPGLSPMTPMGKPSFKPRQSPESTLPVLQEISSPPLTCEVAEEDAEEDADEDSTLCPPGDKKKGTTLCPAGDKKKGESPMFSTEEIRKEIGELLDFPAGSDHPGRKNGEVCQDSLSLSRQASSSRRQPIRDASGSPKTSSRHGKLSRKTSKDAISDTSQSSINRSSHHAKDASEHESKGVSCDTKTAPSGMRRMSSADKQQSSRHGLKKERSSRKVMAGTERSKLGRTTQRVEKSREAGHRRVSSSKTLDDDSLAFPKKGSSLHGSPREKISPSLNASRGSRSSRDLLMSPSSNASRRLRSTRDLLKSPSSNDSRRSRSSRDLVKSARKQRSSRRLLAELSTEDGKQPRVLRKSEFRRSSSASGSRRRSSSTSDARRGSSRSSLTSEESMSKPPVSPDRAAQNSAGEKEPSQSWRESSRSSRTSSKRAPTTPARLDRVSLRSCFNDKQEGNDVAPHDADAKDDDGIAIAPGARLPDFNYFKKRCDFIFSSA